MFLITLLTKSEPFHKASRIREENKILIHKEWKYNDFSRIWKNQIRTILKFNQGIEESVVLYYIIPCLHLHIDLRKLN